MRSHRVLAVFGLIVLTVFALPHFAAQLLPAQQGRGGAAGKRCVGITASVLRSQNPVITPVYCIFDDGSVETYDDGAQGAKWMQLGS
jgi:hypothetical protein